MAARVDGTLVREYAGNVAGDIRLGHPSGVLPIDAAVRLQGGGPWAERVTVYRTARRIVEGFTRAFRDARRQRAAGNAAGGGASESQSTTGR